ncbi:uncharacterized protein BO72DRAFT_272270 [Aspergillus fijiensis CBS 313.89]|uniref:Uncharacterized protein n=1 Tax=Aspergillus fijiensis CBS 313.89 TaxID=1448319 RepID=A0A8G1RFT6_9EURO|nr:uncharacterized protein BO72DRAFT_272270 [Aspergillus fijiensis CBS 313.89]RAK72545.1 hypothetical protein BO72DRAFT_272270 [Aspergillus fijiensis CBS 313.89]
MVPGAAAPIPPAGTAGNWLAVSHHRLFGLLSAQFKACVTSPDFISVNISMPIFALPRKIRKSRESSLRSWWKHRLSQYACLTDCSLSLSLSPPPVPGGAMACSYLLQFASHPFCQLTVAPRGSGNSDLDGLVFLGRLIVGAEISGAAEWGR